MLLPHAKYLQSIAARLVTSSGEPTRCAGTMEARLPRTVVSGRRFRLLARWQASLFACPSPLSACLSLLSALSLIQAPLPRHEARPPSTMTTWRQPHPHHTCLVGHQLRWNTTAGSLGSHGLPAPMASRWSPDTRPVQVRLAADRGLTSSFRSETEPKGLSAKAQTGSLARVQ